MKMSVSCKSLIVHQQIRWQQDEFMLTSDWCEIHSAAVSRGVLVVCVYV